jgi:hypothetical protein
MKRYILVTGSTGAIGSAISKKFKIDGDVVCGIDQVAGEGNAIDHFIKAEFNQFVVDEEYKKKYFLKFSSGLMAAHWTFWSTTQHINMLTQFTQCQQMN